MGTLLNFPNQAVSPEGKAANRLNLRPMRDTILVRGAYKRKEGCFFIPDAYQTYESYDVLSVGPSVKCMMIMPDMRLFIRHRSKDITWLDEDDGYGLVPEKCVIGFDSAGCLVPISDHVMILRDNREQMSLGGIVIPEDVEMTHQSLTGVVKDFGVDVPHDVRALLQGKRVGYMWHKDIVEVSMDTAESDEFYIMVPYRDLLFIADQDLHIGMHGIL